MPYSTRFAAIALAIAVSTLLACGGGDDASSGSSSSTSAPAPTKPVSDVDQLTGTWFRKGDYTKDMLVGVEFAPDGKTISFLVATGVTVHEATLQYAFLDNGRIRVTHPQFPTESQVAVLKVAGNTLSLEPETHSDAIGMIAATFDRLTGKSIPDRLKERVTEIQEEREAMRKRIATYLEQPHLVLVPANSNDARIAIERTNNGHIAYQRVGQFVIERQARLGLTTAGNGAPTAILQLGTVTGPPGAPGNVPSENIQFDVEQPTPNTVVLSSSNASAGLRDDAAMFAAIKRDYDAIVQARREKIDRFHEQIGHFVLLEAPPINANAYAERVGLLRVDGTDNYRVAITNAYSVLMPANFNAIANVHTPNDAPQLQTPTHVIVPDTEPGTFIVSTRSGGRRFTTIERLTKAEYDARLAQHTDLVKQMQTKPLQLVGTFLQSERGYVRPLRFELTSADGKTLAGKYHSDAALISAEVNGDIQEAALGLVFRVNTPKISSLNVPGGKFDEDGTFTLHLQLQDGVPVVTGRVSPGDRKNVINLTPPSSHAIAELRQMFADHLKAGGKFAWDRTGGTGTNDEVHGITLAPDADNTVKGTVTFRRGQTAPVAGQLSEDNSLLILDLVVGPNPEATSQIAVGPMRLYIIPFNNTIQLSGHSQWQNQTRTRYISYAPAAP